MSSSVFFKFKSQKEPTRVEFDGTGISVFELKREIITKSGLGDGTDFDLAIYTDDNAEEYDDDTTIIPRSTTVVARRLPPIRPGAGRAARYISGKMPINARFRKDAQKPGAPVKPSAGPAPAPVMEINENMTEEEKMKAMFAAQSAQWTVQKEEMAHQQPVYVKPTNKRVANVPDHEPPNGYVCYRCSEKGHWIQQCPTNDDPEFDNRPRVKRTTGIPRSFLTTVDKSVALAKSGDDEEGKRPAGVMVNADGDYVIARPDKASWERFQAKAKTSAEASKLETSGNKDLQERGLECSIDKKMFVEPTKTPCCGKTFCNDCITNALMFSDFVCPACHADNVLIDDLKPDEDMVAKIKEYVETRATRAPSAAPESPSNASITAGVIGTTIESAKSEKSQDVGATDVSSSAQGTPQPEDNGNSSANGSAKAPSPEPANGISEESPTTASTSTATDTTSSSNATTISTTVVAPKGPGSTGSNDSQKRKRPVDELQENPRIPKAPRAMQMQQQRQAMNNMFPMGMPNMPNMPSMPMMPFMMNMPNMMGPGAMNMPPMGPNMMGMMGMNMGMGSMGGPMGMGNMDGGSMGNMGNMGNMNNMGNMGNMGSMGGPHGNFNNGFNAGRNGVNQNNWNANNRGFNNNFNNSRGGGQNNWAGGPNANGFNVGPNAPNMGMNMGGMGMGMGMGMGNIQAAAGMGGMQPDEDAYFRKPLNPNRHQNRGRRVRPSDYREL